MSKPLSATFIGEGSSDVRFFPTTKSGVPFKPAGAPWPFARLTVRRKDVKFDAYFLQPVHKNLKRSEVSVSLGRQGNVYFRTHNDSNGIRFVSTSLPRLLESLREYGYDIDDSWEKNMSRARIAVWSSLVYTLIIVTVVVVFFLKQFKVI